MKLRDQAIFTANAMKKIPGIPELQRHAADLEVAVEADKIKSQAFDDLARRGLVLTRYEAVLSRGFNQDHAFIQALFMGNPMPLATDMVMLPWLDGTYLRVSWDGERLFVETMRRVG